MKKNIYGISRTRDRKGAIIKQDIMNHVNCVHTLCGGCWETMWVLLLEVIKKDMAKVFRIRKLTPRSCFRLMGVSDSDIDKIQAAKISDTQCYKMAGNSIVVQVLEGIFTQMFRLDDDALF